MTAPTSRFRTRSIVRLRPVRLVVAAGLAAAVAIPCAATAAHAADPGRWRMTGHSDIPLEYFQGVTSDTGDRNLFFDGFFMGLYRTDLGLREEARSSNAIPPEVTSREGYNHLGDLSYDRAEGGRLLLPAECFYPGQPNGGNTCRTGSIGVADPATLRWRYYVKLDPAFIAKAMWNEVSPAGDLIWTSSGADLIAYRAADVKLQNAAPGGPLLRPVRRISGGVPPSGITGAVFYGGRLLVAGQGAGPFQVWSIDLESGSRRLEIEQPYVGESEGLDVFRGLGGVLHWQVQPLLTGGRPPTFGPGAGALVHFVPLVPMKLSVSRTRTVVGHTNQFFFRVTIVQNGVRRPVRGALVSFAGRSDRTSRQGIAMISRRFRTTGLFEATATKAGLGPGTATVRVDPR